MARINRVRLVVVYIIIASLFLGLLNSYTIPTIQAKSLDQDQTDLAVMTPELVIERFSVTEDFIQQKLMVYTINQIYAALMKSELDGLSIESAFEFLYPEVLNLSSTVTSSVYQAVPSPIFDNLTFIDAALSNVTGSVYEPDGLMDIEEPESEIERKENSEKVTEDLQAPEPAKDGNGESEFISEETQVPDSDEVENGNSESSVIEEDTTTHSSKDEQSNIERVNPLAANETVPPVLEKAPVFSRSSINEAPYSVGINNESISSISGNLSLHQSDLSLPGRGGLSFNLTRQYDSNSSQYYEMEVGEDSYQYPIYKYYIDFNAERRQIMARYIVKYLVDKFVEEDRNNDGVVDNTVWLGSEEKSRGTFSTEALAVQEKNKAFSFTVPSDTMTKTDSRTSSSTNSLPTYIPYNSNGYSGTLYPSGSPTVQSGQYTPLSQKTATSTCVNGVPGVYKADRTWTSTGPGTPCPQSKSYNENGYTGTLSRIGDAVVTKDCLPGGTPTYACRKDYTATYSGTVIKPGSDTRIWNQYYWGNVSKPGYSSTIQYGPWQTDTNGTRWRYGYPLKGTPWVDSEMYEGTGTLFKMQSQHTTSYSEVLNIKNIIESNKGKLLDVDEQYTYYIASSPNATTNSYVYSMGGGYTYKNEPVVPADEKMYPIGKGWSWGLPSIETTNGKSYMNLAGGERYEIVGSKLKGYEWEGLSVLTDTTVQVNGEKSQYVLSTVDGLTKKYFTQDGRLIQISDVHANKVQFFYTQNATYGRKLLSQVIDAIGNSITINYTETAVTLTKGKNTVTYNKHKDASGIELLDAVTDTGGRRTTYSYQLANAKTNLINDYPERAKSNPYALLTSVQHPTGAVTAYQYETAPVTRYMGESSINEVYRVKERKDQLMYSNGVTEVFNRHTMLYSGDLGQSYGQDTTFTTTLDNGLTQTTFTYKKDFIDTTTGSQYYLEQQVTAAEGVEKKTTHAYEKRVASRNYAVSVPTRTITSDNKTSETLTNSTQYDDYGNVLMVNDAFGAVTTYNYDNEKKWLLSEQKQIDGSSYLYTSYTRNALGDVTQATVRKDNATGEVLQQISNNTFDAYGNSTSRSIINSGKSITTTVDYSSVYQHAYPTTQSVVVTDVDNQTQVISTSAEYEPSTGLQTASIDGNNNRTEYTYDRLGRVRQVVHPDRQQIGLDYNDTLNTLTYTDESGYQTRTTWNGLGLKIDEGNVTPTGYQIKAIYNYNPHQQLVWTEDALGNRQRYEYDRWSRATKTILANGSENIVAYNDTARKVTETDAIGYTQAALYDKYGRLIKQEEQQAATGNWTTIQLNSYEPVSGQLLQQTDANKQNTSFEYTILGQLSAVTNSKQERTSYKYDQLGNLTQTIYPDQSIKVKSYDELSRLIKATDVNKQNNRIYYDANGNRSKMVDKKGQNFNYTYNSRNFLLNKQGPSETIAYTYATNGNRQSMTDNTGTTQYTYNENNGELNRVTYPDGKSISYAYDDRGLRTAMSTPFADSATYSYNTVNQLTGVTWNGEVAESYSYLPNGLMSQKKQANGSVVEYEYKDLKLTGLKNKQLSGEVSREYAYDYDANSNITKRMETTSGTQVVDHSFTYDSLKRISTSTLGNESYSYDVKGNRSTLASSREVNFVNNVSYEYDEWDRLTKVVQGNKSIKYRYNGDNLLVEREEDGTRTRYYYDGQQIISEGIVQSDGTVQEKVSYLRGNGLIMQERVDQTKGYYSLNGHGDVAEIRDETGNILNTYEYDLWGNPTSESETISNLFRYSGEYWDKGSDLQYLRARWYDPSMGRFINEDTYEGNINNPMSLNLYTYVQNNPLIYVDPTGYWNEKLILNLMINEQKIGWQIDPSNRSQYNKEANRIRAEMRKQGISEKDIMQSTDLMISDKVIQQIASAETQKWIDNNPFGLKLYTDAAIFVTPSPFQFGVLKGPGKVVAKLSGVNITFSDKFSKPRYKNQVADRGWTNDSIAAARNNPVKTGTSKNPYTGNEAKLYYVDDVHYVAVDNGTGKVIQVADLGKADWKMDLTK
ncbi:hypothetical protein PMSD_20470 [Paenibacillus macquariensis subsp. defensor]|nr:hypothetical protein PMSD_20470 [Paenibacillus macquariensis subsp. defensor]